MACIAVCRRLFIARSSLWVACSATPFVSALRHGRSFMRRLDARSFVPISLPTSEKASQQRSSSPSKTDIQKGITECHIVSWSVKPGDRAEQFDPVCQVSSDKATVEVESPTNTFAMIDTDKRRSRHDASMLLRSYVMRRASSQQLAK